jgi:hypothetical protein
MEIKELLEFIKSHKDHLEKNHQKLEMYEGKLLPYVQDVMKATLSEHYYKQIEHRIIPINVLTRIIDKLSKVYSTPPIRKDEKYQDFIDRVVDEAMLDVRMGMADEYSHLFKGYALEPYIDEGKIQIRTIPYDRFLVYSNDSVNPTKPTVFIKMMGKVKTTSGQSLELYYAYSADEFLAFTSDGSRYEKAMEGNNGINPYGVIPFVYGNRSMISLIPQQDTDITQLTLMIPVLLSDLAGAIMFSCFSVIYGIDLKIDKIEKSPNSFWNFKTDAKAESPRPEIGTIKTDADIEKVLSFIKQTFAFWLETKGVRIGSLNSLDAGNVSGISKIIDEMDVYEIKKKQITFFKQEESQLWELLKVMNNYWVKSEEDYQSIVIGDDFAPTVTFDEPRPEISRKEQFEIVDAEYKGGYMDAATAIMSLYPDLNADDVSARALALDPSLGDTQVDDALQDKALNGAQVASLKEIVMAAASRLIPVESAVQMIVLAFQVTPEQARLILSNAGTSFVVEVNDGPGQANYQDSNRVQQENSASDSERPS